jgi:hypothetical protein
MGEWLRLARDPAVVRRALRTAALVGTILTAINHGSALLHGDVDLVRVLRIGLTVFVPYAVSTTSSVAALRSVQRVPDAASSSVQSSKRSSSA